MKKPKKAQEQTAGEVVPVNFVRVETLLRRYPMHMLQSQGSDAKELVIRDVDAGGKEVIRWRVLFLAPEGTPGALAYRIDRLIIDRCLEKHTEIPLVLKLGTLSQICQALDMEVNGKNTRNIKTALLQLQGTMIDVANDLAEGRFSRYQSLLFTGDKLPDGTRSNSVYIKLSDDYQAILRRAVRRPLDYDYLRALSPGSSRLYEIVSSRIFAALSRGAKNPEARILYSEFTEQSALTRYWTGREMRKQMKRLDEPHITSGYIKSVSFDARTDKRGMPDWMMIYIPGEKARREFNAATKRGSVAPSAEVIDITDARPEPVQAPLELPATKPPTEAQALAQRLVAAGVWITKAQALVELYPNAAKVWADVYESGFLDKKNDPAAYLVKAIGENAKAPKGYRDRNKALDRLAQEENDKEKKREWEREELARMRSYLEGLSLEEAQSFDREALAALPLAKRKMLDLLQGGGREETLDCYRLAHWRRVPIPLG